MPLPSVNKAAHSGFETQMKCHLKSKTEVSAAPQKERMSSKIKKKDLSPASCGGSNFLQRTILLFDETPLGSVNFGP